MQHRISVSAGRAAPLGATPDEAGVNFAVFSANATRMVLCLFDEDGRETRIDLPEREGDIWHGHVAGLTVGQAYGFRAYGPYAPDEGHRFNPNKLLLDPYARQVTGAPVWDGALYGYTRKAPAEDLSFDPRDSAPFMPRAVVAPEAWPHDPRRPATRLSDTVIYEAHVKGLTAAHPALAGAGGTFAAAASDPILDHLTRLGITAIEFLPCQFFLDDHFLVEKGLVNYWGYQPIGYFAPDPRYLGGEDIFAFRRMVDRFHGAGIEVILDVVYNHTGEGGHLGPTLSFRGLDNASYYRLMPDARYFVNDTGTGNTLATDHPMVLRLVMDSLRYWATSMGVDGFRFDLGASLARTEHGFDRNAPLLQAMRQDPVLSQLKLIMEPWDIGPGGYQLGNFSAPFLSWNDKFRDGVRRFWRGDPGRAPDLATRVSGSADLFDHSGRRATSSVNFLTAHDGFTLEDVVSYRHRHNAANGEGGKDGHGENYSDNLGVEGPTDKAGIRADRARRKRNMIATLLLSQGTPMILGGDELGNSQGGNNNAYNQDNETGWIDWTDRDPVFHRFVRRMIAFRRAHPIVRQAMFLHSRERAIDGFEDIFWRRTDGAAMGQEDWLDPDLRTICVEIRTASGTPHYAALEYAIFLVFNAGEALSCQLPEPPPGQRWSKHVDTAAPDAAPARAEAGPAPIAADSLAVFVLEPAT
ncbi:glycogen debranching protein GlgX [Ovoidimarina sediminis]|uniref:glycogen debranching protein GlgX n=1 Tax=Ovoidimarina sediminis TaxID=3079856 RepID=UPI002913423B|nr:glycogen debranching protein GlgX [Rhodophyticola sp. MJ-SS7]MDU8942751.1 glycogen debranching protein GlgX [Rhodophyticola sp. MJ-SS7]